MSFDYKRLVKFEINVGEKEQKIRLIAGSIILSFSLFNASIIMLLVGVVLIATGYTSFCPVYSAMERSTVDSSVETEES